MHPYSQLTLILTLIELLAFGVAALIYQNLI